MKQLNFEYTSNNLPNTDVEELIDLYYELNNNIPITNPNHENTMVRCRSSKFKTLNDIRNLYFNNPIIKYLEPVLVQAEQAGIKGCYDFISMIIGNHPRLPEKTGVVKHFHRGSTKGIDCNVYTLVYPVSIVEPLSDYIWMHWVEHDQKTANYEEQIRNLEDLEKLYEMRKFAEIDKTRPRMLVPFPDKNEKLTIEFNGTHWLHSVEESKNNIYFVVVLSDTRE
jgi:hypothetical protein